MTLLDGVNHISVSPQMALKLMCLFQEVFDMWKTTLNQVKFLRF